MSKKEKIVFWCCWLFLSLASIFYYTHLSAKPWEEHKADKEAASRHRVMERYNQCLADMDAYFEKHKEKCAEEGLGTSCWNGAVENYMRDFKECEDYLRKRRRW